MIRTFVVPVTRRSFARQIGSLKPAVTKFKPLSEQ